MLRFYRWLFPLRCSICRKRIAGGYTCSDKCAERLLDRQTYSL